MAFTAPLSTKQILTLVRLSQGHSLPDYIKSGHLVAFIFSWADLFAFDEEIIQVSVLILSESRLWRR